MRTAKCLGWIWLLVAGAGCMQGSSEPGSAEPGEQDSSSTAAVADGEQVRPRAPASYYTTLVVDSDGERYTDGDAFVRIMDVDDTAQITLTIQAWNAQGKTWSAAMRLPETALRGERAEVELDGRPDAIQVRSAAANAQADAPALERPLASRLELARVVAPGKRPFLQGVVDRDAGAKRAEFRTEYGVECLVPPQALGLDTNGSPDPSTPILGVFVVDERFETPFCKSFAAIR